MKRIWLVFPMLLMVLGAVVLFEQPAYAYADPGTGLLAIQALGSALVATGWYLRRKIYTLLHGQPANPAGEPSLSSSSSESAPES